MRRKDDDLFKEVIVNKSKLKDKLLGKRIIIK